MKLGLICQEATRIKIEDKIKTLGITFYDNPDLYLVEKGEMSMDIPHLVFDGAHIESLMRLIEQLGHRVQTDKVIGYEDDTIYVISVHDILYFEAKESLVYMQTRDKWLKMKDKLYELEAKLPPQEFVRISRSYIVNINHVASIAPWFNRRLIVTFEGCRSTVEVSKNYVGDFKRFLGMR